MNGVIRFVHTAHGWQCSKAWGFELTRCDNLVSRGVALWIFGDLLEIPKHGFCKRPDKYIDWAKWNKSALEMDIEQRRIAA